MNLKIQMLLRTVIPVCLLLLLTTSAAVGAGVESAAAPVVLRDSPGSTVVELLDGTLKSFLMVAQKHCASVNSTDGGRTWSEPQVEFELTCRRAVVPIAMLDRDGELHVFLMVWRSEDSRRETEPAGEQNVRVKAPKGRRPGIEHCIDIWHCKTSNCRQAWNKPEPIFKGYVGSINGVAQLAGGRIVLPHQYQVPGRNSAPPTGSHVVTATYSDDGGKTWNLSPAKLTAPCRADFIGNNYGACEPTIVQLKDGRVWILMRTQTGFLYESFSTDGVQWSEAKPSQFYSSSSPASLVRIADGRIVLFWNNCEEPSRVDGKPIYVNRDALHAAISTDEGKTWRGYREVYRDPRRNQSPASSGDQGTAYPHAVATKDGNILLISGQGEGRRNLLLVDPNWLCQTHQEDDFSNGLDGWCVFKPYGPVQRVFRSRTQGARLVDHPDKPSAKILHVRRPDEKDGDDAIWNFPVGRKGKLTMKIMLQKGFAGAHITLADRFFYPGDVKVLTQSLFLLPIAPDGSLPDGSKLEPGRWYTLDLQWDLEKSQCRVVVDGQKASVLIQMNREIAASPGASYLRLRSTAEAKDTAGFLVESVKVDVVAPAEVRIEQHIEPGKPFLLSDGTTYDAGERFLVNGQHRISDDMVVQGDTVVLKATGDGLDRAAQVRWRIVRGCGKPKLMVDTDDPATARFVADGYGVNEIAFEAVVDGYRVTRHTQVFVEFSTGNMLLSKEEIPLPPDADQNPFIDNVDQEVKDHREQVTARNPKTGRLITLWQVKFGGSDASPMGVGVMASDDHGITWKNKQYIYRQAGDNSGWGSLCWNPAGNDGEGEFLLWTCSHVRSPDNRIMLFRSRDDGHSWQHVGDYQQAIAKVFGTPNAIWTYFGVNRTVCTSRGTLVAPMVCHQGVQTIRSEDNGQTWQAGNIDSSFPRGNEDALVETIDGGKLILMARPPGGLHNHRFESTDEGKTWAAKQDTTLPTAGVNFGLDKIVEPGTPEHGRVVYSAAATRRGPHKYRQRLVVAINRDPIHVARDKWDVRLLWDASCNYSDILYLPDDKSLLVTVETIHPGRTNHSCATIRYFKMSLRYWHTLPPYSPVKASQ